MRVGVWLPTFTDYPAEKRVPLLLRWAERAEELGFSSLWAVDHLLRISPNPTYAGLAWLDPLQCLALVSARTTLPLGTIYCGCMRNPVLSWKEISTLQYLTGGRLILSPVLGWYGKEHELAGFPRSERGRRTDEWLDILELLSTQQGASYHGSFHSFSDVTIDPLPGRRPLLWATGGAAYYEPDVRQDEASLKPRVIDRILRSDGWIVSAQASGEKGGADIERLRAAAHERGDDASRLTIAHTNFVHLVETTNRELAYDVQAPLWNARRTIDSTFDDLSKKIYLTGTIDDVIEKLRFRSEMYGLQEFIAHPHPCDEESQLELWAKHLLPALADL